MRILVLDDMEVRHDGFDHRHPEHKIDHAYNVEEALFYLRTHVYELVYLDHDLAPEHYIDAPSEEATGYDIAVYISKMFPAHRPSQIIIHSWNPVGAERMYKQLQGLGMFVSRKPF
jgi:hypothetical protein